MVLCDAQERYVYADEEALCYKHLTSNMVPIDDTCKRIPYSTIEFVGPFNETQFVIKCSKRAFTFQGESEETRNKWIKNIAALSGCSATTQICHKSTAMGQ